MNLPTIFFMTSKQTPFGMKAKKENLTTGFYKMQRIEVLARKSNGVDS